MPKIRAVKPETWTDSKFVRLSPYARLLFLGMWNYACDNGHIEADYVELKMRILPADNCDVAELVDEILSTGQAVRIGDFLKVPKLPSHQRIDMRYLTLCDQCEHDGEAVFSESDRTSRTQSARRANAGRTPSTRSAPVVDGDGDGDGDGEGEGAGRVAAAPAKARRGSRIPEDFTITEAMAAWAAEHVPDIDVHELLAEFIDYWISVPGQKGVKLDWEATWRNGMRKRQDWAAERSSNGRVPKTEDSLWDRVETHRGN